MQIDVSFVRSLATAAVLTTAALPTTGCLGGSGSSQNANASGGDPDDPLPEDDVLEDPHSGATIDTDPLARCADGMTPGEIEDTVAITFDFEVSAHEMIACGGLVFGIVGALVEGLVDLAQDPDATTLPDGFSFDDQGTYFVEPNTFDDLRMEVRFYLGRDYSFGSTGDLVTENLFVMSTYLVDPWAEVVVDTSSGFPEIEVRLHHGGPGPLVELLGLGAEPPNPIIVTDSALAQAQAHLSDMEVESIIFFTDRPGVSTIEYDVESPRMLASSFLTGAPMALSMVGADGWRLDLEQDLDVETWTVEYADSGVGALDGDIDFIVRGGPFDYVSRFRYDGSGWPRIELACAD